jgi:hypothetical protein
MRILTPTITALALASLLWSCERNPNEVAPAPPTTGPALSSQQLDAEIWQQVRTKSTFEWTTASDHFVWSALLASDFVLAVGYAPIGCPQGTALPDNAALLPEWQAARDRVLAIILAEERKAQPELTAEQLIAFPETVLPVLDVRVKQLSTVQRLRRLNLVRYAEPLGYEPHASGNGTDATLSDSGCDQNPGDASLVAGVDYLTLTTGSPASTVKSGWNQADSYHGIRSAWSQASGAGIKLLVIDSGCSLAQENLNAQFNQGLSSGRTMEHLVTLPRNTFLGIPIGPVETPNDGCGHGTSMVATAAAPRGTDGAAVGIAYNANAITVHAAADVLIDESREAKGVTDAFTLAGNRADVRIISMSMGRLTSSSQITDGIRYASARGKLIFCAAGTSFGWTAGWVGVIFPATLPEVIACTGVKDNLSTRCDACHVGSKVEFTVVMERSSGRHGLCLALTGDVPGTVGGSSVATSSMAGMAAVVWSRYPSETKDQIKARLVAAASNRTARDPNFGYGRVNLGAAVGVLPL